MGLDTKSPSFSQSSTQYENLFERSIVFHFFIFFNTFSFDPTSHWHDEGLERGVRISSTIFQNNSDQKLSLGSVLRKMCSHLLILCFLLVSSCYVGYPRWAWVSLIYMSLDNDQNQKRFTDFNFPIKFQIKKIE